MWALYPGRIGISKSWVFLCKEENIESSKKSLEHGENHQQTRPESNLGNTGGRQVLALLQQPYYSVYMQTYYPTDCYMFTFRNISCSSSHFIIHHGHLKENDWHFFMSLAGVDQILQSSDTRELMQVNHSDNENATKQKVK